MKKKRPIPTRRRKALKRLALFAVLAAALVVLEGYHLTPTRAIRSNEESCNCGETEVVLDMGSLPLKNVGMLNRLYLSGNENAALVTSARFYLLLGWQDYGISWLDCGGDSPLHAQTYSMSKSGEGDEADNWRWYLYGRVDDPAGELLTGSVGYREVVEGEERWVELEELEFPASQWTEGPGGRYFMVELPPYHWSDYDYRLNVRLELRDGAGNVLLSQYEPAASGTSFG